MFCSSRSRPRKGCAFPKLRTRFRERDPVFENAPAFRKRVCIPNSRSRFRKRADGCGIEYAFPGTRSRFISMFAFSTKHLHFALACAFQKPRLRSLTCCCVPEHASVFPTFQRFSVAGKHVCVSNTALAFQGTHSRFQIAYNGIRELNRIQHPPKKSSFRFRPP